MSICAHRDWRSEAESIRGCATYVKYEVRPLIDRCVHCEEGFTPEDVCIPYANGPVAHKNCAMRALIGSVAHIEGRCSCVIPGAIEGDDPALTTRQAADAAVAAWERRQYGYLQLVR